MVPIQIKRIYEPASPADGKRILVDRLWPRGMSKESAQIDLWPKELTPSTALRRWFHQDDTMESRWDEFRTRYRVELETQSQAIITLRELLKKQSLTLLTAAKNMQYNHATFLRELLLDEIDE